jgi:hypothetical protein
MKIRMLSLATLALLASGCPGHEEEERQAGPTACAGTYAGALNGAFNCTVDASYDGVATVINIYASDFDGNAWDLVPAEATWAGPLSAGTYSEATGGFQNFSAVFSESAVWVAALNSHPADIGSFTLTINSAAPVGLGPAYGIHGSFGATLRIYPVDAAAQTIALAVTF